MHELSIVRRLIGQIAEYVPRGAMARSVNVKAGALQAIDPQAMYWAWEAATRDTALQGATLNLECLPWQMHCPDCDRRWVSNDPTTTCTCGCDHPRPCGGDELILVSIEVDDDPTTPCGEVSRSDL